MTASSESQRFPHPQDAILLRSIDEIARFTLPFYAGRDFIVTASHVLDDCLNRLAPFFLPPREEEGPPLPLIWKDVISWPLPAEVDRRDDPIDVCVVELTAAAAEHLRVRRRFAELSDLGTSRAPQPALYLMTGYPLEDELYRREQKLSLTEARHYVTELHEAMTDSDRSLQFQLWLKYARDRLITSRCYEPRFPDPNGISGCGVWKVLPKPSGIWTPRDRRLVAVEHTHVASTQQIRATRIELVLQMIATEYLELSRDIADGFEVPPAANMDAP